MHEQALMRDVLRKVDEVAAAAGASRVTRVFVRVGPLSHFTPEHFREHFAAAARGTCAEEAVVEAVVDGAGADRVLIESVEIEEGS